MVKKMEGGHCTSRPAPEEATAGTAGWGATCMPAVLPFPSPTARRPVTCPSRHPPSTGLSQGLGSSQRPGLGLPAVGAKGSSQHRAAIAECVAGVAAGRVGVGRRDRALILGPPRPQPDSIPLVGFLAETQARLPSSARRREAARPARRWGALSPEVAAPPGGQPGPRPRSPRRVSAARASGLPTPSTPRSQPPSLLVGKPIGSVAVPGNVSVHLRVHAGKAGRKSDLWS